MHKNVFVALTFFTVFLAGCDFERNQGVARYTPGHPTYIEDSRKWLMEDPNSLIPVVPPKSGDRGVTAWTVARYLNKNSGEISWCHLEDGTIVDFVRDYGNKHVLVSVHTRPFATLRGVCKGEVAVSLEEFVRYRYNYLISTREDTELRRLFAPPK